jgi:hypothetical protein
MKKLKRIFWFVLSCFILSCVYLHVSKDSHIATLTITGITSTEDVEWKNPSSPLEKATLKTHEIYFSFPKEKQVHAFFWGDLIGIRYKYMELSIFFHLMGFSDFIEVEALCSDYLNLKQKEKFPTKVLPIEKSTGTYFTKLYRSLWQKLFSGSSNENFFIKRATLKTEYFLLTETSRSFRLSCEDGKLVYN